MSSPSGYAIISLQPLSSLHPKGILNGIFMGHILSIHWLCSNPDDITTKPHQLFLCEEHIRDINMSLMMLSPSGSAITTLRMTPIHGPGSNRTCKWHGLEWECYQCPNTCSFMDLSISIVDGWIKTTLFEKPQNLYLYTPLSSSYPKDMLNGLIMGHFLPIHRQLCSHPDDITTGLHQFLCS